MDTERRGERVLCSIGYFPFGIPMGEHSSLGYERPKRAVYLAWRGSITLLAALHLHRHFQATKEECHSCNWLTDECLVRSSFPTPSII